MNMKNLYEKGKLWYYKCPNCTFSTENTLASRADTIVLRAIHEGKGCIK